MDAPKPHEQIGSKCILLETQKKGHNEVGRTQQTYNIKGND